MTRFETIGATLTLDGQKVRLDRLVYTIMPRVEPVPSVLGVTTGDYSAEVNLKAPVSSALHALLADESSRPTQIRWREDRFAITFEVQFAGEGPADVNTEIAMSSHFVPGGLAAITCTCCGQGRAYSNVRAVVAALRGRWRRHVCPRGREQK